MDKKETGIFVLDTHGAEVMLSMEIDGELVYMQKINNPSGPREVHYPRELGIRAKESMAKFKMSLVSVSDQTFHVWWPPEEND